MAKEKQEKKAKTEKLLTVCDASQQMIDKGKADGVSLVFERAQAMKPCPIGAEGSCCKNCAMGPCRLPAPKKKKEGEEKRRVGVCGATIETITARNFARMVAGGSAAHSDHGRGVAEVFLAAAKGEIPGYGVKDEQKLYQLAMDFGIDVEDRDIQEIAIELGEVPYFTAHYYALFAIGFVLFIITFLVNLISDLILHKFQEREL